MRSPALFATGITMISVGSAGFIAGGITTFIGLLGNSYGGSAGSGSSVAGAGAAIWIASSVVAIAGIPITIVGGKHVRDEPNAALRISPARVALEVTF